MRPLLTTFGLTVIAFGAVIPIARTSRRRRRKSVSPPEAEIMCAEQLISEYVDGDLSPSAAGKLEDHFDVCMECRTLLMPSNQARNRVADGS